MKKSINILAFALILIFSVSSVYADNNEKTSSEFKKYFEQALTHDSFYAHDQKGTDITNTIKLISNFSGTDAVYEFMKTNSVSFGYTAEVRYPCNNNDNNLRAVDETVVASDTTYVLDTDTKGRFTKEWVTKLIGVYYLDGKTGLVKKAKSPHLYLETANFGSAFSPYIDDISTTATVIDESYAKFTASYHMYATLEMPIGKLPIGFKIDFNGHEHTFTDTH